MADEILYAVADSIATITLNRPERRNALNTALMDALAHRFDALESDTSVRAVVIRGAGQAFCSGRDLNEMSRRQDDRLEPEADASALGQKIVEIIGPAFTRQILLTGQPVDAGRAYEMGMVHAVVPAADLERATYDLAKTIADNAPLSLAGMKSTIRRALSLRERVEHK